MKESAICHHRTHECDNNFRQLPPSQRETIAYLTFRIQELEKENASLKHTVKWMHDTIWDMVKKQRQYN